MDHRGTARRPGRRRRGRGVRTLLTLLAMATGGGAALASCAGASRGSRGSRALRPPARIEVVAGENQYGDVVSAVGGRYVQVRSVMRNPNTDPHTLEATVSVARQVSTARLVVQNGAGYDGFMNRLEAATPSEGRTVIDVRRLLGLPADVRNPHLWYEPRTMPAVARAVASVLGRLQPSRAALFSANAARFDASLAPWRAAIATVRARFSHAPVAVTEPVADYLLAAARLDVRTPWVFQADVMNGVDPAPQALQVERDLIARHEVKALVYNDQVVDPLTTSLLALARSSKVPVVGVYETMPTPGYHYGTWMLAETRALEAALADHRSTSRL